MEKTDGQGVTFLKTYPGSFVVAMFIGLIFWTSDASAGTILDGYEKLDWNSEFAKILKLYPRGQLVKLGSEVVYKQQKPTKAIARRNFAFNNGKLHTISQVFEKNYVEKIGIERLLDAKKKIYGEGRIDRSQAPHMVRYIWYGLDTKTTFAYAPKRPDMTMIIYEQVEVTAAKGSQ